MEDQILVCVQCDEPFFFTSDEQLRFSDMDFDPPKRCPGCRKNRSRSLMSESHERMKGKKRRLKRSKNRLDASSMEL